MKLMIVSPGFLFARCKYLYRMNIKNLVGASPLEKSCAASHQAD